MQNSVSELAQQAVEMAKKAGAQHVRARVTRSRDVSLERSERDISKLEESAEVGLALNLIVDGRYGSYSTSDLRSDSLEAFISNAVKVTRYLSEDTFQTLPPPELYEGFQNVDLKLYDQSFGQLTPEQRKQWALTLEEQVLASGKTFIDINTSVGESMAEVALVNSNGFAGYRKQSDYYYSVYLNAEGQGGKKVSDGDYSRSRFQSGLAASEALVQRAIERTFARIGAAPLKTQRLPMIIENRVAGRLMGQWLDPMNGARVQQKQSILDGKLEQQVASPVLTLIDDPHLEGGFGSTPFDGEGIPTKRRVMMEKGILKGYYVGVYYANKLGWKPTTAGVTNLSFEYGTRDAEALMKAAGKGILVTGFLGGNSNSTTGDFSLGVNGFYFENGKLVQPVQEMNIAGNLLEFWKRLKEVGNDPFANSPLRTPSLLFDDVLFSGV